MEKTGTEIIAREIALFHGGAMIIGNRTLAAIKGFGSWGHSPEKYADRHWREYIGAAEVMLARINRIHDETIPRDCTAGPCYREDCRRSDQCLGGDYDKIAAQMNGE